LNNANWKEVQEQIEIDATVIKKFNDYLDTIHKPSAIILSAALTILYSLLQL